MKKKLHLFFSLVLFAAVLYGAYLGSSQDRSPTLAGGTLPEVTKTAKNIRILLVPGHEPTTGGAYFHDLNERDLNVQLAQDLRTYLESDGRYEVLMTRDELGWNPTFKAYFKDHRDDIIAWRDAARSKMSDSVLAGTMEKPVGEVDHKAVDEDVSVALYGINKWANENDIDITLHVHFNEHRKNGFKKPGEYSGFTIYVPSPEYGNAAATRAIAEKVMGRLSAYDPTSNFPGETDGLVNEPDLIAIGAHDTAKAPSLLIEYGYIYEERFTDSALRDLTLKDLAHQTYAGLRDAFKQEGVTDPFGTAVLPRTWQTAVTRKAVSADIYALQTALAADGDFPPEGVSKNDCPRSGTFGDCTVSALTAFQRRHGIVGEDGFAGKTTLAKLNGLFSAAPGND